MTLLTPRAEQAAIQQDIDRLHALLLESVDDAPSPADHTNMLVGATIGVALLTVGAIVLIFIVRPDKDNSILIATIVSILVPIMTALLAGALQQVKAAVDGRLTQLLKLTAAKARAEGVLAQKEAQAAQAPP
jgi:transcription elongation GreA/GreB family factor